MDGDGPLWTTGHTPDDLATAATPGRSKIQVVGRIRPGAVGPLADGGRVPPWATKAQRRADRALVAAYHEARLAELVDRVAAAVDRYRAGERDAYKVDEILHRYQRAARELWKFCWLPGSGSHVEMVARHLERLTADGEAVDWWDRGEQRRTGRTGDA